MRKFVIFANTNVKINILKTKKPLKVIDHCHYTSEYKGIHYLKFSVLKEIAIVVTNRSDYDHHSIMKVLAELFKENFICLGGNTEKYISYTFLIEKEVTKIDENGQSITETISCRFQFIDSTRFIVINFNAKKKKITKKTKKKQELLKMFHEKVKELDIQIF